MLFRPCGAIFHDNECKEPVINFSENTRCVYHTMMPPMMLVEQVCNNNLMLFQQIAFFSKLYVLYLQDICVASPLISVDDEIEKVEVKIEVDDAGQTCG